MATKAQVRNTAAGFLGRRRLGQAITDDLKTRLDEAYTHVYEDLKDEALAIWASNGTIPDEIAIHVSALMAFDATSDVGVSNARYNRIVTAASLAKPAIRKKVTPDYESLDDPEDF